MKVRELILQSEEIIKCLAEGINPSETSLKETEEKILDHVNRLGQIMVDEVVERASEPVYENREENALRRRISTGVGGDERRSKGEGRYS